MDVILNMTEDGIRLVFDPISQRLKIIEVIKNLIDIIEISKFDIR